MWLSQSLQVLRCTLTTLALDELRQEDHQFSASLDFVERSGLHRETPSSKNEGAIMKRHVVILHIYGYRETFQFMYP